MKTLYLQASPEDVADAVIFSGDPGRVRRVCEKLENVRKISENREFVTYTGSYRGMPVTVTSTGIGAPSAAIAMEEMYACGMKTAVRFGTVMGIDRQLGEFIIPRAAMREESTSSSYVRPSYPAAADFSLVNCMNAAVEAEKGTYTNGIVCSMDGYYSQMKSCRLSEEMKFDVDATVPELKKYHIVGLDMETSLILTLGALMNIRACSVTLVTVLDGLKEMLDNEARIQGEYQLIHVVLEGLFADWTKHGAGSAIK